MTGSLYGFVKRRLTNHEEEDLFSSQNKMIFFLVHLTWKWFLIKKKRQKKQKTKNKTIFRFFSRVLNKKRLFSSKMKNDFVFSFVFSVFFSVYYGSEKYFCGQKQSKIHIIQKEKSSFFLFSSIFTNFVFF